MADAWIRYGSGHYLVNKEYEAVFLASFKEKTVPRINKEFLRDDANDYAWICDLPGVYSVCYEYKKEFIEFWHSSRDIPIKII